MNLSAVREHLAHLTSAADSDPAATLASARDLVCRCSAGERERQRIYILRELAKADPDPVPAAELILGAAVNMGADPVAFEDEIIASIALGAVFHGGHSMLRLTDKGRLLVATHEMAEAQIAAADMQAQECRAESMASAERGT